MYRNLEAGRMLNSVSLDKLAEEYIRNIYNLMTLIYNSGVVVFDFDGTITEFKYAKDRLLPCKDDEIDKFIEKGGSLYNDCCINNALRYIIEECENTGIPYFILTQSMGDDLIEDKNKRIFKEFPFIPQSHVLHVYTKEQITGNNYLEKDIRTYTKTDFLTKIHDMYPNKKIVFVEDNSNNILKVEEDDSINQFIAGYHISSLLTSRQH